MAMSRMSKSRFEMRMFLSILEIHSDRLEGLLERSLRFLGVKSEVRSVSVLSPTFPDSSDRVNLDVGCRLVIPDHIPNGLWNIVFPRTIDACVHIA